MSKEEITPAAVACRFVSGVAVLVVLLQASCSTLVDEIRIRTDPNTIVKPDVDELRELEIASGTYEISEPEVSVSSGEGELVENLYRTSHPGVISRRMQRPRRNEMAVSEASPGLPDEHAMYPSYPSAGVAGEELPGPESFSEDYGVPRQQVPSAVPQAAGAPQYVPQGPVYDPSIVEELR
jgi:hypothetical protein